MKVNLPLWLPSVAVHRVCSFIPGLKRLSPLRLASAEEDLRGKLIVNS